MSSNSRDRILIRGDRLRVAREKKGYSQRELGRILGLGVNQINRYEKEGNDPTAAILAAIAQELNVTIDYLLGLSDIPQGYATADLEPDQRHLVDAYIAGDSATVVKLMSDRLRELEAANAADSKS